MVTIIIPIYNLANYLERCLTSVSNQDYKNIEVILVDDGSTDASLKICQEFVKNDSRFKYILQSNLGVSAARNTGINQAHGDFLTFVDGDDFIDKDHISSLVQNMTNEIDLAVSGRKDISGDGKKIFFKSDVICLRTTYELIQDSLDLLVCSYPWNKLYKTQIIRENQIFFPIDLSYGEDLVFNIQYILNSRSGIILNNATYNYFRRVDSITKRDDRSALASRLTDLGSIKRVIELLDGQMIYQNEILFLYKRIVREGSKYYALMNVFSFPKSEIEKYRYLVTDAYSKVCEYLPIKEKIKYQMNLRLPRITRRLVRLKQKNGV